MPAKHHAIRLKRIYTPPAPDDGTRILVDRLWPRGISKANAHIDFWAKATAPSNELRQWFHQHQEQCAQFRERYREALDALTDAEDETLATLRNHVKRGPVTLLSAVKLHNEDGDEVLTHLQVLRDFLTAH